jgi:MerR family transcriptional regulator, thiopeptide resistance regulator
VADRRDGALDRAVEPSADMFIEATEVMTRMERYYTPEQLAQLRERAEALGDDGLKRAQDDWMQLIAEVEAERRAGTDPADPKLAPLIERWNALVEQFTGGDPGVRAGLQKLYDTEGAERASRGAVSAATMAYARRALDAR